MDEDTKPVSAKSLTVAVRCYESRLGKLNTLQTNTLVDQAITLWSKPDHVASMELSSVEYPFKIIIPVDSPGFSTANFQEYKVAWRVEAGQHIVLLSTNIRLIHTIQCWNIYPSSELVTVCSNSWNCHSSDMKTLASLFPAICRSPTPLACILQNFARPYFDTIYRRPLLR